MARAKKILISDLIEVLQSLGKGVKFCDLVFDENIHIVSVIPVIEVQNEEPIDNMEELLD